MNPIDSIHLIELSRIQPGPNDRTDFNQGEIEELALDIAQNGLAQPVTLRRLETDFEIVAGERRVKAYTWLHENKGQEWAAIPAIIRDYTDEQAAAIMLSENLKRVNLNPLDEAVAYQSRMARFGWSVDILSDKTGKSKDHIKSRLALLDLRPDIQHLVKSGQMPLNIAGSMKGLDHNYQLTALLYWQESKKPTAQEFRKICQNLLVKQQQAELFDWSTFMQAPVSTVVGTLRRDTLQAEAQIVAPKVTRIIEKSGIKITIESDVPIPVRKAILALLTSGV